MERRGKRWDRGRDGRVDCTQSPSFLLVIERLEGARCATAREIGVGEVDYQLYCWTPRKERECMQSSGMGALVGRMSSQIGRRTCCGNKTLSPYISHWPSTAR